MQTMNSSLHVPLHAAEGAPLAAASDAALDATLIASLSAAASRGLLIEVVGTTGSTNADLRARLENLSQPVLLAAEQQTAGRGRAGRSWQSAGEQSLCFSLAWSFALPLTKLSGLPLVVGVVLAETLAGRGWPVQLKWPNDLLKDGAKLGGILIETATARNENDKKDKVWAVIGVGLNIHKNAKLSAAVGNEIAALDVAAVDRNALLAALADALAVALPEFERDALKPFAARWQSLHAHADLPVMILEAGQLLHQGIARGIDESGRLLLETADSQPGCIAISAGDVSLRTQSLKEKHAAAD